MFKLDDNFLNELGLGSLPPAEKNKMLSHIYETLETKVGMRLAEKMSNDQLTEFEEFIKNNNEAGALKWLESNFPNYKQVVSDELGRLKTEISKAAPQIVAQSGGSSAPTPPQSLPPQQPLQSVAPQPQQPAHLSPVQYNGGVQPPAPAPQPRPIDPYAQATLGIVNGPGPIPHPGDGSGPQVPMGAPVGGQSHMQPVAQGFPHQQAPQHSVAPPLPPVYPQPSQHAQAAHPGADGMPPSAVAPSQAQYSSQPMSQHQQAPAMSSGMAQQQQQQQQQAMGTGGIARPASASGPAFQDPQMDPPPQQASPSSLNLSGPPPPNNGRAPIDHYNTEARMANLAPSTQYGPPNAQQQQNPQSQYGSDQQQPSADAYQQPLANKEPYQPPGNRI